MLTALAVHNLALIDKIIVDFTPGFNILTGETGAGKSILIDAFNIALGGKVSTDNIREGADYLMAQAVFDLEKLPLVRQLLDENGIDYPENELILSKRVVMAGKSISTANGVRIPSSLLKALGERLVDIHGQHENQQLLRPDACLKLVDLYGGRESEEALNDYRKKYALWKSNTLQLKKNKESTIERERTLDILSWEIDEIEKAALGKEEDRLLEEESRRLENREKITAALSLSYNMLEGENNSPHGGVLVLVAKILRELETAGRYDVEVDKLANTLRETEYVLSDIKTELASRIENEATDPGRLEFIQQRLDTIYKLKKKYGTTMEEILAYCTTAKNQKEKLLHVEENTKKLEQETELLLEGTRKAAGILSSLRKKNAGKFAQEVEKHIHDLAMEQAKFIIMLDHKEDLAESGQDIAEFSFSANPGQSLKPLNKVASGGELSRVALALKTVLLDKAQLPTMVFDEIDTGVGGATAQRMAEKIAIIASVRQVLCITHLPQIACMADNHIYIDKKQGTGNTTHIELVHLSATARTQEITRMVAGDNRTDLAIKNAGQMLKLAEEKKRALLKKAD